MHIQDRILFYRKKQDLSISLITKFNWIFIKVWNAYFPNSNQT